jgi:hypothetical protein
MLFYALKLKRVDNLLNFSVKATTDEFKPKKYSLRHIRFHFYSKNVQLI